MSLPLLHNPLHSRTCTLARDPFSILLLLFSRPMFSSFQHICVVRWKYILSKIVCVIVIIKTNREAYDVHFGFWFFRLSDRRSKSFFGSSGGEESFISSPSRYAIPCGHSQSFTFTSTCSGQCPTKRIMSHRCVSKLYRMQNIHLNSRLAFCTLHFRILLLGGLFARTQGN